MSSPTSAISVKNSKLEKARRGRHGTAIGDPANRSGTSASLRLSSDISRAATERNTGQSQARVRLTREDNLLAIQPRQFVVTTDSHHELDVYLNLARRMKLWHQITVQKLCSQSNVRDVSHP